MTDKQLNKIVTGFVKGLLGNETSKDMCYITCLPLQGYLSLCGIETTLFEGEIDTDIGICHHFWLELKDGRIIDPTADQFNSKVITVQMPRVFIGKCPIHYKNLSINQAPSEAERGH